MIRDVNNIKPTLSSLPLEVIVYFDWHYSILFFVLNVCIFTYKGTAMNLYCWHLWLNLFSYWWLKLFDIGTRLTFSDGISQLCFVTFLSNLLDFSLVLFMLYYPLHFLRCLASKGNKTSQVAPLTASMLLSFPIVVLHAYYMELQLYV